MTEPADAPEPAANPPPGPTGDPDNVLETFKADVTETDNDSVHDAIGGRPRLNWSPVTDGGGRAPTESTDERSSFHFDLGGALARLGEQPSKPSESGQPPAAAPTPPPPSAPQSPLPQRSAAKAAPLAEPAPPAPPTPVAPIADHVLPQRAPSTPPPEVARVVDDPLPQRGPSAPVVPVADHGLPQRGTAAPPADPAPAPLDPLPRRGERPAAEAPLAPAPVPPREPAGGPYVTARRSVFDDSGSSPNTTMPPSARPPASPIVPPAAATLAATPTIPAPPAPTLPPASAGPLLPTLPAAIPHATPMYTPPIDSAPSTPDINAFRSAQLRASRQQRKGKMFSRTLLALFAIGLAVAGALYFGRQYLFPTEWDQSLTPIVDDIQNDRGVEFDHTVGLVKQPSADYALTIGRLVVDDSWMAQVPVWRALGLTTGEPTADGIAPALASSRLAVYDPDADRIYMSAEADPEAAAPDLRLALEEAFAAQQGSAGADVTDETNTGFLGVSPPRQIVDNAVSHYLAQRETAGTATVAETASGIPSGSGPSSALPLPIEYELAAVDDLGEALLAAAGVDPASVRFDTPYPDNLGAALDDGAHLTPSGALEVGDRSLAAPVALGNDDWSLVWGSRLPQATVDQLASIVVADSFRPIDRGGLICAVAVFETTNPTDAASVLAAMQTWVAGSPAGAQSTVAQLSDTRVQLSTCDPGADAAGVPQPGDVDALINRQLTRLAG
jgi:hypothetical protein